MCWVSIRQLDITNLSFSNFYIWLPQIFFALIDSVFVVSFLSQVKYSSGDTAPIHLIRAHFKVRSEDHEE